MTKGRMLVRNAKMYADGRIRIPIEIRRNLGFKTGNEYEIIQENGNLIIKPIKPDALCIKSEPKKWGKEAFLNSGKATFGE
jgi:bifunctional DNA-binding transcriptional regulator/antitoxin component of YhaV-PrlF toxin-antitoxin module